MTQLQIYAAHIDKIDKQLNTFKQQLELARQNAPDIQLSAGKKRRSQEADDSMSDVLAIKGKLAQMHGTLDKLQMESIDAVMTGPLTSGKADAKELRKALTKRCEQLTEQVQQAAQEAVSIHREVNFQ